MDWFLHRIFTLALSAVSMNRGARKAVVEEKVVNKVGSMLVVNEDHRAGGIKAEQQVAQAVALAVFFNQKHLKVSKDFSAQVRAYLLFDVLMRGTQAADRDAHMSCVEILFGECTRLSGEGGGEEHVVVVGILVAVSATKNLG